MYEITLFPVIPKLGSIFSTFLYNFLKAKNCKYALPKLLPKNKTFIKIKKFCFYNIKLIYDKLHK